MELVALLLTIIIFECCYVFFMSCFTLGIHDFKTWTTGEDTTQIQMAHAAGVTEITIRNRLKDLKIKLKLNN